MICCILLTGCNKNSKKTITICSDEYSRTTIEHKVEKITFIKYELIDTFETVSEAIDRENELKNILEENKNLANADKEFEWSIIREDKKIIIVMQTDNYSKKYTEELEDIKKSSNQICKDTTK